MTNWNNNDNDNNAYETIAYSNMEFNKVILEVSL